MGLFWLVWGLEMSKVCFLKGSSTNSELQNSWVDSAWNKEYTVLLINMKSWPQRNPSSISRWTNSRVFTKTTSWNRHHLFLFHQQSCTITTMSCQSTKTHVCLLNRFALLPTFLFCRKYVGRNIAHLISWIVSKKFKPFFFKPSRTETQTGIVFLFLFFLLCFH